MDVKDLKAAEYNPRNIDEKTLEDLKNSIKAFGDISGIVYNRKTGNLVGGHQRVKVFKETNAQIVLLEQLDKPTKLGTVAHGYVELEGEKYSYREVEWDKETEQKANLAANKIQGEWDNEKVAIVLGELPDIELTGFTEIESNFFAELGGISDANGEGEGIYGRTGEVNISELGDSLDHKCPKCGFEFK